jgi:hypothetical protein
VADHASPSSSRRGSAPDHSLLSTPAAEHAILPDSHGPPCHVAGSTPTNIPSYGHSSRPISPLLPSRPAHVPSWRLFGRQTSHPPGFSDNIRPV